MLILTRRVGESIIIGNDVKVTVMSLKGNQVRIGVDAPKSVSVQREEISKNADGSSKENNSTEEATSQNKTK